MALLPHNIVKFITIYIKTFSKPTPNPTSTPTYNPNLNLNPNLYRYSTVTPTITEKTSTYFYLQNFNS